MKFATLIYLDQAEVLSVKDKPVFIKHPRNCYNIIVTNYVKAIMVNDSKLGKVWFKTSSKFAYSLHAGDHLSCRLIQSKKIEEFGKEIIFAKRPTKISVIN